MRVESVLGGCLAAILVAGSNPAAAAVERSLCVFDPIGANGDLYQMAQDYAVAAHQWGVDFRLEPYTNESTAAADFRAGECDAVGITGIRNRDFVRFAGSLDMMGGAPNYEAQRTAIRVMASPEAAKYMREGPYETVGVVNMGKVYGFARDRELLSSWKKLAGKKVAVIDYDEQASTMVDYFGGTAVPATIATFANMFNNGSVDLAYAPAYAYSAFEMHKGLGEDGGILDYNLGMLSAQVTVHYERFPEDFGQRSREWVADNLWDDAMRIIREAEEDIPERYRVEPPSSEQVDEVRTMAAEVRDELWQRGVYSHEMQRLLKRIRCRQRPDFAECAKATEGGPVSG